MASTYSGNLAIELIGTGDQAGTWGQTTNTNLGTALEQAITSSASVTFIAGGNSAIALTQSNVFQAARSARLTLAGAATATQYLWVPAINKQYIISNGLSNAIIISNGSNGAGSGTTVTVPSGRSMVVYNDSANIVEVTNNFTTLTVGTLTTSNNVVIGGNVTISSNTSTTILGNVSISNLALTTALPISSGGTSANTAPLAMANLMGFTNTATAGGTTTLSNVSSYYQLFTGTLDQTVVLPVANTVVTGWTFHIANNSTGNLAVQSSGANAVITVVSGTTAMCTCILASGTTEASWEAGLTDFSTYTGTGSVVLGNTPTLANPTINAYTESVTAIGNSSTTQTINIANSTIITATLTANCTWTMPSNTAGKSFILLLKTGNGGFTSTFTGVKFPANTAPTITTANNSMDILSFIADGANWYGNFAQGYIP
jgi:hypothetical protein